MLFNQKEFEHKISDKKLKKGLRLFLQHKVECLRKSSLSDLHFLILDQIPADLFLQKKGEKILNYKCSCSNKEFCEHLAAALFYLQKEDFLFEKKQELKPAKKINRTKNEFENYFKDLKETVKPFLVINKLSERNINEINKSLAFEKNKASAFGNELYFDLAIILQLSQLIPFISQSENTLTAFLKNSIANLEASYHKGLSVKEKETWIRAAENSLRSQIYFRTGAFYFLLSKAMPFLKDKKQIQELLMSLKKRKEPKNNLLPISKKLIIEIQLSVTLTAISEKKYAIRKWENTLELPIALSEIEFNKKNTEKGFKILEDHSIPLKNKNVNRYLDLVDHILIKAKEKNRTDVIKHYLSEKFIYGYYIDENDLDFYFKLILPFNVENEISAIVKQLKSLSVFYTFDKIAVILFHQNCLDELISEIKKEKNKFVLLNKIAVKKLPEQSENFLQLYSKHLSQAITEAKFPYFQEEVFNKTKIYLDLLSEGSRKTVLEILQEKMLYNKHMQHYIEKLYPII